VLASGPPRHFLAATHGRMIPAASSLEIFGEIIRGPFQGLSGIRSRLITKLVSQRHTGNHETNTLNLINMPVKIVYYSMTLSNHDMLDSFDSSQKIREVMK
jgi:hypothetical protein